MQFLGYSKSISCEVYCLEKRKDQSVERLKLFFISIVLKTLQIFRNFLTQFLLYALQSIFTLRFYAMYNFKNHYNGFRLILFLILFTFFQIPRSTTIMYKKYLTDIHLSIFRKL